MTSDESAPSRVIFSAAITPPPKPTLRALHAEEKELLGNDVGGQARTPPRRAPEVAPRDQGEAPMRDPRFELQAGDAPAPDAPSHAGMEATTSSDDVAEPTPEPFCWIVPADEPKEIWSRPRRPITDLDTVFDSVVTPVTPMWVHNAVLDGRIPIVVVARLIRRAHRPGDVDDLREERICTGVMDWFRAQAEDDDMFPDDGPRPSASRAAKGSRKSGKAEPWVEPEPRSFLDALKRMQAKLEAMSRASATEGASTPNGEAGGTAPETARPRSTVGGST
jgi:hypothetical protein